MKKINLKINGQAIICDQGKTIMQAALEHGLELPNLCFHPDLSVRANCRICVVEITGREGLTTACSTKVEEGMEVITDSEPVKRSRNLNIELIFAEHIERCYTCVWLVNCKLLALADKYKIEITKFSSRKIRRKIYQFANAVEIDGRQCVDCRNCLEVCNNLQKINYLKLKGKGVNQEIAPVNEKNGFSFRPGPAGRVDCVYCGQCAVHCPVGAAREQTHWQPVQTILRGQLKTAVVQFASSVSLSLGEEFGAAYGKIIPGQTIAALKQLGFNYVFDVNFAADVSVIIQAEELLKEIKSGGRRPILTSNCPAWVKYIEFYRPDLIPNITRPRSLYLLSAGLIKTYWAEKMKLDSKKIAVVSVMPCTAKKFEASRAELKINGQSPVDYVITTRELAWLIKKNRIDFSKLKPAAADNPLDASSAGGVMESALSAAEYLLTMAQDLAGERFKHNSKIEFKNRSGWPGIKEAEIKLAGKKLRIAAVNGLGNLGPILEKSADYDYVEVMACPDGCIGGGGQPTPTTAAIRKKRLEALSKINIRNKIVKASENKSAAAVLAWLKGQEKLRDEVLYTKR